MCLEIASMQLKYGLELFLLIKWVSVTLYIVGNRSLTILKEILQICIDTIKGQYLLSHIGIYGIEETYHFLKKTFIDLLIWQNYHVSGKGDRD